MFLFSVFLATLALVASTNGEGITSLNSGSEGDQYQERERKGLLGPSPVKTTSSGNVDATDRTQKMGPNSILSSVLNTQNRPGSSSSIGSHDHRLKRSYYPYQSTYNIHWPQFDSLNTWKPNFYPIQRPYFVPIFGFEGRIPLYYPQMSYYPNPGKPPYVGPTYLPPGGSTYLPPVSTATPPPQINETTKMPIDDRFGNNDDDDRPIWDNGNGAYFTTPKSAAVPTRKPMSSTSTFPPLVHKTEAPKSVNHLSNDQTGASEAATIPPSIPRPQGPSKCVWAIVSCCSTGSKDVSYECFDQLGCGGPFWDVNPCDTEYAKAAIQTALNYYNSRF